MKNIFFIAFNTVREIKRQKALYALIAIFFFLIGIGLCAVNLSLSEQKRLSINFSYTACHISLILTALYFASHLIAQEREKKTLYLILTKPVLRGEFIAGKFLGLLFILLWLVCVLTLFVIGIYKIYGQPIHPILFMAMSGIFMEALWLSAFALLFSLFMSSFLALFYSAFVCIIGHFVADLLFFVQKEEKSADLFNYGVYAIVHVLPDLERLNWRAHALYQDPLPIGEWALSLLYALCWTLFLLLLTNRAFKNQAS